MKIKLYAVTPCRLHWMMILTSRTKLYYCHPYSSWERGTNEVTNKLVRRKIPKGENFDSKTDEEIQSIENWINNYPRRIHEYRTAGELFAEEVRKIG